MPGANITPLDYSTMTYVKPPPSNDEIRIIIRDELKNHSIRSSKIVGCIGDLIYLIAMITLISIIYNRVNEINDNVIQIMNK